MRGNISKGMKNKGVYLLAILTIVIAYTACKPVQMAVSPELKQRVEPFKVTGKQGFNWKQVIRFGNYYSEDIKRGWSNISHFRFFIEKDAATDELQFTQKDSLGNVAEVICASSYMNKELPLGLFSIEFEYHDNYSGSILLNDAKIPWTFFIANGYDSDNFGAETWVGELIRGEKRVSIIGTNKIENVKSSFSATELTGYEYFLNGKSIGAVEVVNNGRVWIIKEISKEHQLLLASMSTALMLRTNLKAVVEESKEEFEKEDDQMNND